MPPSAEAADLTMPYDLDDTIAAIASPPGGAARGIVRLSGPHALACMEQVFEPGRAGALRAIKSARCIPGRALVDAGTITGLTAGRHGPHPPPQRLPADLFLWPDARSYTRQPIAELHTLGSPPLLDGLLQTVCRCGARPAEPGEFTMRAFLAGRLDLAQAEAVLGLINARSTDQLQCSLRQLAGGLSGPLHAIREELLRVLAELEAGLDFVEEDITFITPEDLGRRIAACERIVSDTLDQMTHREDRAADFRVVLAGPPNAGKSSLFNALVNRCRGESAPPSLVRETARTLEGTAHLTRGTVVAALVSDQAGTTRDYLVARLPFGGRRCELVDTAGVEVGVGRAAIDHASQEAAEEQLNSADLLVRCVDASALAALAESGSDSLARAAEVLTIGDWNRDGLPDRRNPPASDSETPQRWTVLTKADLVDERMLTELAQVVRPVATTSTQDGAGLEHLIDRIAACAGESTGSAGTAVAQTAARCRDSLLLARDRLMAARELAAGIVGDELVAVELRDALHKVGLVVGAVYTDDILDRIFSQFCIGK